MSGPPKSSNLRQLIPRERACRHGLSAPIFRARFNRSGLNARNRTRTGHRVNRLSLRFRHFLSLVLSNRGRTSFRTAGAPANTGGNHSGLTPVEQRMSPSKTSAAAQLSCQVSPVAGKLSSTSAPRPTSAILEITEEPKPSFEGTVMG